MDRTLANDFGKFLDIESLKKKGNNVTHARKIQHAPSR